MSSGCAIVRKQNTKECSMKRSLILDRVVRLIDHKPTRRRPTTATVFTHATRLHSKQ